MMMMVRISEEKQAQGIVGQDPSEFVSQSVTGKVSERREKRPESFQNTHLVLGNQSTSIFHPPEHQPRLLLLPSFFTLCCHSRHLVSGPQTPFAFIRL
jgi:hypothetical protein